MIITIIFTIFLGFIAMVDKALGSVLPLTTATAVFYSVLGYVDTAVFFIRAILPLTISNIFGFIFLLFNIALLLKIIGIFKSFIPFVGRTGSGSGLGSGLRGPSPYKYKSGYNSAYKVVGIKGSTRFPQEVIPRGK